jgi:homoserine O-acetyltransferase
MLKWIAGLAALAMAGSAWAQENPLPEAWHAREGDYVARNFRFKDGERLAELRIHYLTLGEPKRDAAGHVTNAVMVLHGTGGSGRQFLRPQFADVLYKPGGVLDPAKYFIILPDGIGHGKSSKPSDGLHMKFPKYDYDDMVAAQHALLVQGLKVDRLRLILGTSMGCMHAFVWGETWPDFARALAPFACEPTAIVGRNRLWRALTIQSIEKDPAWQGGDYKSEPVEALRSVEILLTIAGSAPIQMQKDVPTREAADARATRILDTAATATDANDFIYQADASRNYDPSGGLEKIKARVLWINSADDFINPPELGLSEKFAPRLRDGRYILVPTSEKTHGHGTHTWAAVWQDDLRQLMAETAR